MLRTGASVPFAVYKWLSNKFYLWKDRVNAELPQGVLISFLKNDKMLSLQKLKLTF